MTKKDVLELKRRFKKSDCTFTKLCGCYVDGDKNRVVKLDETFLNLDDEEFYKYLEIAKKTLSGTIGNNLLELDYPLDEEEVGGRQQFLMALRDSKLKNEDLLDRFYDLVIDNYSFVGNFLILIYHDAYDVIVRTTDHNQLDESEEVYEYLLCAICPVTLTKPGLGYREDENRIGPRIRDWIVGVPDAGFVFPAFTDRSTDIHSVMCYNRNTKEPHVEFMEGALGCIAKPTATEQKEVFHSIIRNTLGEDEEESTEMLMNIQEGISDILANHVVENDQDEEPVRLTSDTLKEVMTNNGISDEDAAKIEQSCQEEFGDTPPAAEFMIDGKAIEKHQKKKQEKELVQQVQILQEQLAEKDLAALVTDEDVAEGVTTYDVVLRVKPEKANQIKSQVIAGQKCLVIPMDDNEHVNVNGINTTV